MQLMCYILQVNATMAARLLAEKKESRGDGEQQAEAGLLADDRFRRMFEDPEFAIDETAGEFKDLHPNSRMPGFTRRL